MLSSKHVSWLLIKLIMHKRYLLDRSVGGGGSVVDHLVVVVEVVVV